MNDVAPGELAIQVLGPKDWGPLHEGAQPMFLFWNQDGRLMGGRIWGDVSEEARNLRGRGWRTRWLTYPKYAYQPPTEEAT